MSALLNRLDAAKRAHIEAAINGDVPSQMWLAPWTVMKTPDLWQREALSQIITLRENLILCCSRGAGKTETVSAAAYVEACNGGYCMILSRSDRQAMRVFSRVAGYAAKWNVVGITRETMHELHFANGGRVIALPCREDTIRGEHGVTLLIIDEAARVPDAFYGAVTPMIAIAGGHVVLLSTPFGKRGFFWKEWDGQGDENWRRHEYPWQMCPRLKEEFIQAEVRRHGQLWVDQEYGCQFVATESTVFDVDAMLSCFDPNLEVRW